MNLQIGGKKDIIIISNLQDNHVGTYYLYMYDATKGVFSCSLRGTYIFHPTLRSFPNVWVELAIVMNDVEVAFIYSTWPTY